MMRMATVVFATLALLTAGSAAAASAQAPAQSLRLDDTSATQTEADEALRVADDPSGTLTLKDVRAAPGRFFPLNFSTPPAALPHRYWLRCEVVSGFEHDVRYSVTSVNWDELDVFVVHQDGSISEMHGGIRRPMLDPGDVMRTAHAFDAGRSGDLPRASAYLTFDLRAHENATVYARVGSHRQLVRPQLTLVLERFDELLERTRFTLYFGGVIVGILSALALYSLVIFGATRDRSYLWYAVYLFAIAISSAGQTGLHVSPLTQFVVPKHPVVGLVLKRMSDPVAWFALILFTRNFFRTFERFQAWDKALLATALAVAATLPVVLLSAGPGQTLWIWQGAVALCLATGIMAKIRGVPAPYFIVGQAVVSVGSLVQVSQIMGYLDWVPFPTTGVLSVFAGSVLFTTSAVDALIFSLALSDRLLRMQEAVNSAEREREAERMRLIEKHEADLEVEVAERTNELRLEKENSDRLLTNILPARIAEELKHDGVAQPHRFEDASILFADFKDFTTISGLMPARSIVEELDAFFCAFDDIMVADGLEKIKTIGDAYMAAAGLPEIAADHAERCVRAGLAMQAFVEERNRTASVKWELRIGIHSGAVVAGVVGRRKFTYDVWGDTVNIAARVQASSPPGSLSISAYTHQLVRGAFRCEYRGKVVIKGKGEVDMYVVLGEALAPGAHDRA